MKIQQTWLGSTMIAFVLPLLGCANDDDKDDGASEGATSQSDGKENDEGEGFADDGEGFADDGEQGFADDGAEDGSSEDAGESSGQTCDGSWSLGSTPYTGEAFIERCDANPPQNCLTGNWITFDDGDCFCLPECARAGLSEGDACTNDGAVTCTRIENDAGSSSGVFCVPPEWNLCG